MCSCLYAFYPTARYKCQEGTDELLIVFFIYSDCFDKYVSNFTGDLLIDQDAKHLNRLL